jgi:tRNA(fMet)-specific endonuclease VapC
MSVIYLLDTNTLSYIAKGKSQAARARLASLRAGENVCISSITEAEVRYGLAKRPQAHRLHAAVEALLFKLQILPWGSEEAVAYGKLRARLEAAGTILSELDLQIAAHAIAAGAVLVTNDNALRRIKELNGTVNWAADV